jgi:hypothetical protein
MTIPSVMQGLIETEDGKVFELDSPKGSAWLESIGSFRFEPAGDSKACTVRREPSGYWYGCRKVAGKVRKKYIGKTSEVNTAKLEEIAAALEVPPQPGVTGAIESVRPQDSQLRKDIAALYAINARLAKAAEPKGYTPSNVARAAIKAQSPLMATIEALEAMDDIVTVND